MEVSIKQEKSGRRRRFDYEETTPSSAIDPSDFLKVELHTADDDDDGDNEDAMLDAGTGSREEDMEVDDDQLSDDDDDDDDSNSDDEGEDDEDYKPTSTSLVSQKTPSTSMLSTSQRLLDQKASSRFSCPTCAQTFVTHKTLQMHLKTHEAEARRPATRYWTSHKHKDLARTKPKPKPQPATVTKQQRQQPKLKPKIAQPEPAQAQAHHQYNILPIYQCLLIQCEYCEAQFAHPQHLEAHLDLHLAETTLRCVSCNRPFLREDEFHRHIKGHLAESDWKCAICGQDYDSYRAYKDHLQSHLPVPVPVPVPVVYDKPPAAPPPSVITKLVTVDSAAGRLEPKSKRSPLPWTPIPLPAVVNIPAEDDEDDDDDVMVIIPDKLHKPVPAPPLITIGDDDDDVEVVGSVGSVIYNVDGEVNVIEISTTGTCTCDICDDDFPDNEELRAHVLFWHCRKAIEIPLFRLEHDPELDVEVIDDDDDEEEEEEEL